MNSERGIYTGPSEKDFKTEQDIKREQLMNDPDNRPTFNTPLPSSHGWVYWNNRMKERQQQYVEIKPGMQNKAEITFPDTVCINLIGDIHAGAPQTDYERIGKEVDKIVNTPSSYVLMLGDVIDSMFWNPGQMEQIEQIPEQAEYLHALLTFLSDHKRLLVAFVGDHDGWPKKTGGDMYAQFAERHGAYLMQGVGYLTFNVGQETYKVSAAHRLPGHSMYNKTHPQNRAEKFGGARGSDVIVSGHTHQKGYSQQGVTGFGGENQKVHYVSVGPYKSSDDYSRKLGFAQQTPSEMYGSAIILNGKGKRIEYYDDILVANEELVKKL